MSAKAISFVSGTAERLLGVFALCDSTMAKKGVFIKRHGLQVWCPPILACTTANDLVAGWHAALGQTGGVWLGPEEE